MSIRIALLRAINVAGRNKVAMSQLRELLEQLGLTGVRSVLQSGNLVFDSSRLTGEKLESLLEQETAKRLQLTADFLVRSVDEWESTIARNPFSKEAQHDPSHLVIMFLKKVPKPADVNTLRSAIKGPEVLHSDGRQLYLVYPAGIGRSNLTGTLIEQKLQTRGTGRNWNTILKLAVTARDAK
ncbi:MAG TPA: DUF1697 domain-containing protein [Pirellulales bacterium]|jgi:uncharacterized protein (DUF1697 family)